MSNCAVVYVLTLRILEYVRVSLYFLNVSCICVEGTPTSNFVAVANKKLSHLQRAKRKTLSYFVESSDGILKLLQPTWLYMAAKKIMVSI